MIAIYKRELRAYYNSMIGWVFTAAMLILVGIYFMVFNMYQGFVYFSYALASASNMLMLLFRLIGVECCEAAGYDVDVSAEEVYEDAGGHTWVVAKVDGNWYNFDPTYEDTKGDDWDSDTMYFGFSDLLSDIASLILLTRHQISNLFQDIQ